MIYGADTTKLEAAKRTSDEPSRPRIATLTRTGMGLSVALLCGVIGCHRTTAHAQDSAFSYQGNPQDSGQPDYGNLAPVDGQYPGAQNEAQQQAYQYQQGAPVERRYSGADPNAYPQSTDPNAYAQGGDPNAYPDDQDAMDQAQAVYEADLTDEQATEAPPPLPDYDQPPPPDEDYIWTPGYWAWSPAGYYWVPGAWVEPPYVGALWTPGYWAFYGGRYRFHHGFWGLHIGFYGGINYGYGYTGYGYYGGYWRGGHFFYNREVNRLDFGRIHRVYDYRVREDRFAGRPSFNGPRGIMVRPRPAEVAVLRERRYAPLPAQIQLRQQMMQNRQQLYRENHGRPAVTVDARPVVSNHQMPAALPQTAWRGARDGRGQGYRPDANRGGWQGTQQVQPQVQPQGRVMPQQGRQGQPVPQQAQPDVRQGWQARQPYQGRGNWQAQQQPGQTAQPQVQPQTPSTGRQDYRGGQWNRQQPQAPAQAQPQSQAPVGPGSWQGRQRWQQQNAPAQPQSQPQPQAQPQQDFRRGGWQGRGSPQGQPQPQGQQQPQIRRGPEGARVSQPAPQPQAQPHNQPHGQPAQQGREGHGRGDHDR